MAGLPWQHWHTCPARCSLIASFTNCHECRLVDYNAALATICFMLFLGFADDVLDIPWR